MAKILLAEDDDFFRDALKSYLKSKGHHVDDAPNGKVARDILKLNDYDIMISDIQMPFLNGIELLEWMKKEKPIPSIIMTGFSNIIETKSAYELGADEFLAKPFKNDDLNKAISNILKIKSPEPAAEHAQPGSQFCKVLIDEFVARPRIEFDVYVRLSDVKFVKIGYKGDQIPVEQIQKYKEKGVRYLHIHREDFGKLVGFNLEMAKIIAGNESISHEKKMNFMKYTGEVILEKAFVDGVDKESFDEARDFLSTSINIMTDSSESFDLLELLNSHSDHLYAHSIGVAMFAIMLARKLGFESSNVFFKLSMAGIFHDIGKKEIDRGVIEKSRIMLSQSERQLIETHTTRGKEILGSIKNIPSDVIQLVAEHHEDNIGQGYPRRLTKKDLHPLSRIMFLANIFAERTIRTNSEPGMPAVKALEQIKNIYGDRVDSQTFKALEQLFPDKNKDKKSA